MSEAEPRGFGGSDRFEVTRRIGAGGFGVVYEAFDREHRARVALKTLPQTDAAHLYRFKQEFRNLAGVVHPNLATLYELFAVEDSWFFTMEYVDGRTFLEYVRFGPGSAFPPGEQAPPDEASDEDHTLKYHGARGQPARPVITEIGLPLQSEEQFARLRGALRQLAEAIHALHLAGKLHRDIKPSNVLVTPEGRTVLLDFGLTIAWRGEQEDEEVISGTPAYMSPEHAAGKTLGPASDWYSVGCMLYEALTGQLPFDGSVSEILAAKLARSVPPLRPLTPDVPADLEQLCRDLLQRDPADRPADDEILRRLGASPSNVVAADRVTLIGRQEHFGAMRAAFQTVRRGRPVAVFLHGASGEGKSFLVQSFLERVSGQAGAVVLAGRCYEAEAVPYKALDSLIDSLAQSLRRQSDIAEQVVPRDARALIRVFPVLRSVPALAGAPPRPGDHPSDQEVRRRAAGALRELLARLGDRVPVVLCIDDLQWGDVDSGIIISELLRGPEPPVALFIGVYRSEYAGTSPILRALLAPQDDSGGAERRDLPLGLLPIADAWSLAAELLEEFGENREAAAEAIARESGGLPYFIHELVRFVRSGAEIRAGEPIALDDVLAWRVSALPAEPRDLLETIAVAGRPIRQRDAFAAVTIGGDVAAAAMRLRSEHLVRSTGPGENDTIEPYHDRIRETLVARMPAGDRKERHLRLAETLESSGGGDAETLAIHFRGAQRFDKAAHYYAEAARQAAEALAFEHAAELDRESLRLRSEDDPERHALRIHLADALANAGRGGEAAREYEAALSGASQFEAVELRRRAAYQYCVSGHIAEGRAAMRTLLAQHGIALPESATAIIITLLRNRLRLWFRGYDFQERKAADIDPAVLSRIDVVWSAAAGLSMNDIIAGAGLQTYGLILALDSGELVRIARSMAWEATHTSNEGSRTAAKTAKLLDLAQEIAGRAAHPHAHGMATMARGIAEFTSGRWATCVPLLDEADAIFREQCRGVAWELDTAHAFALWALIYMGEFAEMGRRTSLLLKEAEERGDLYAYTTFGTFMEPHALLAADDPTVAREFLNTSRERWTTNGFYLQDLCALMTDSLIDTYEGDGARGFQRYVDAWSKIKASQLLRSQAIRMLTYHFRARAALAGAVKGGRPDLLRAAEADAKRLASEGVAWCEPYARVLFAGVTLIRGDRERAVSLLRQSAEEFDRVNMRSHAVSARRLMGDVVGGSEGEQLTSDADAWFTTQGIRNGRAMARMHVGAVA
jgi:hypothetical protein